MAITAERLHAEVTADTSKARREVAGFQKEVGKTPKAFGAAKAAVASFAGAAVVGLAGKTIMAASDLNEVLSKTNVVFGPAAGGVIKSAQDMADAFGLPKAEMLDAASAIGLVAKASGLSQKASAGMSSEMAKLAADASSFYNVPLNEALDAMKSGLVGEAEPMRRFGVLLNEGSVQAQALAMGLVKPLRNTDALKAAQVRASLAQKAYTEAVKAHGKASPEAQKSALALKAAQDAVAKAAKGVVPPLTEGQKVQARSALIMKGMSDASGDLARTQGSVANRLREIRGRVTNFAADMGTKALPAVEKLLGAVANLGHTLSVGAGFIQRHSTAFKVAAAIITTIFLPAMIRAGVVSTIAKAKIVAAWVAQKAAAISSAAAQWKASLMLIRGWVMAGAAAARSAAQSVAIWTMYRVQALQSSAAVIAAQARMVAATVAGWARMAAAQIAGAAKAGVAMAATVARTVAGWVLMGTQSLIQAARMAAAWIIAMGPIGWAIAAVIAVVALIIANWDKVKAATVAIWGAVSGAVTRAWGAIKGAVAAGVGWVKGVITKGFAVVRALISAYVNAWRAVITTAWAVIKAVVGAAVNGVKAYIRGLSAIAGWVGGYFQKAKAAISSAVGGILGVVRGIPGRIKGALGNLGGLLTGAGRAIIQGLINGVTGMIGSLRDKFSSITNMIPDWKGPRRKDQTLLTPAGKAIIEGLIKGLTSTLPTLKRTLTKTTAYIRKTFSGATEKRLIARVKATNHRLQGLYAKRASLATRYAAAVDKAKALREDKASFADSVRSGISSQANVLNAGNNAGTIAASLTAQVAKAKEFAAALQTMRSQGFSSAIIQQVASAGIEGGLSAARALIAATSGERASINASFAEINRIAGSTATQLSGQMYDAGIKAADGLVAGLLRQQKAVEAAMLRIATSMQTAIKRALGIRSPSRVMDRLAQMVPLGIARGMKRKRKAVLQAAISLADDARPPFRPPGGAPRPPGGAGALSRVSPDALSGGDRRPTTLIFQFTSHNPRAEPQSRTTNKALAKVAALGLV